MNKTIEYINRLQAAYGGASGYKMAQLLNISDAAIYKYRSEKSFMSVNVAYRLALLINEDPAVVIAETQLDHINDPESVSMFQWMLDVSQQSNTPAMPAISGFHAA